MRILRRIIFVELTLLSARSARPSCTLDFQRRTTQGRHNPETVHSPSSNLARIHLQSSSIRCADFTRSRTSHQRGKLAVFVFYVGGVCFLAVFVSSLFQFGATFRNILQAQLHTSHTPRSLQWTLSSFKQSLANVGWLVKALNPEERANMLYLVEWRTIHARAHWSYETCGESPQRRQFVLQERFQWHCDDNQFEHVLKKMYPILHKSSPL